MKPIPANLTTVSNMVRSIVSFTNASNRKVAAPVLVTQVENTCPTKTKGVERSVSAIKQEKRHSQRKKEPSLTEVELGGCSLCYSKKTRNKRSHSDTNPNQTASSESALDNTGASPFQNDDESKKCRALKVSSICPACSKRGSDTGSSCDRAVSTPQPLLHFYRNLTRPKARKIQFARELPNLIFDNTGKEDDESPQKLELPATIDERQLLEQQERPSWDDLLRSLKKDRRRKNNFALTADEFQDSIFPNLQLSLQQAVPPSA